MVNCSYFYSDFRDCVQTDVERLRGSGVVVFGASGRHEATPAFQDSALDHWLIFRSINAG